MKRRTKILLLLFLALILGFIFLLPHGGYRRAVAAFKKQLLARGEKLTVAELTPPPVSDTVSNGAKPLLAALTNYYWSGTLPNDFSIIAPGVASPQLPKFSVEQMINYDQNTRRAAALRPALNASVLDFNLNYSFRFGISLPHLSTLSQAESLASGTALQAFQVRELPEAVADLNAAVDVVRLFPKDPFIVTVLVRIVDAHMATYATWEALQSGQLSDAQLAELQSKWNSLNLFDGVEAGMAFERAFNVEDLALARKSFLTNQMAIPPAARINGAPIANLTRSIGWVFRRYPGYWAWRSSWSYDEEMYCLQVFDNALQAARRARATGAFVPALNEYNSQTNAIVQRHPNAIAHFWLFRAGEEITMRKFMTGSARWETFRRLTVVAIALKRYYLRHEAYPANLNQLVPDILPELPADFMDGQPLRYCLKADGNFLLYSVGEDGKDDGGDATPLPSATQWIEARDIVWPRAAPPQEVAEYLKVHPPETNAPAR